MSSAVVDSTNTYRYVLLRLWDSTLPTVCFCMLNPSTADAGTDDPTIRRCINFAKAWGFGSLTVVNLFAYRTSCPRELKLAQDPVGPLNMYFVATAVQQAAITVAAWGIHGTKFADSVLPILRQPYCLGLTVAGQPRHPLYVPRQTDLRPLQSEGMMLSD